ncbi:hypothetical protein ONS95_006267 [Cadophora gregata]|uniref:uncharacterized protein n=1 Tax=Cadophora gregata TaxID=51156 RepID=UPI0026DCF784|nr:uncharacterized protein ONS95_006267 [Cadophora gregata]KAK0102663.1 hypothetical protein ONS95_006267 [Cadophora gregata]KAK0104320.1 hypothetical protein ONS96_005406 [Cadophora gregata f. sp. sojae]
MASADTNERSALLNSSSPRASSFSSCDNQSSTWATDTDSSPNLNPDQRPDEEPQQNRGRAEIIEPSNGRLALVLGSIWVGVVLTALDSTIVATLLAPISNSFSSLKTLSWLGASYLIAGAATQPLSGRLTDIFGRRAGLIVCNIAFGIGTVLCGIATTEWLVILGRAIAGSGGMAMVAISTFVGSDLVPLRKRGVVQGLNNVAMGCGAGLGGLLGGWLDSVWGWRFAFLVQVPFIAIGTILVLFTVRVPVKLSNKSALQRIDYLGSLTLTAGLVLLLLGLNAGGNIIPWSHPLVRITLPLSVIFLAVFVYVEIHIASEPIIPMGLLLNLTVASACATYEFAYMAQYGIMFFTPLYLQLLGSSPTQAGLRFIPQSAGTAIGALCTGIIIRATGNYRWLNMGTQTALIISTGLLATMDQNTPAWCPFLYLGLYGLGFGSMLVVALIALISSVDHQHQAVVTSASFAFRSTGSAIGLTLCSVVFQNMLRVGLTSRLVHIPGAEQIIERIRGSFDEIWLVDPAVQPAVKESYMAALNGVFLLIFALTIVSAAFSFSMRQNVLHTNLGRR